MNLTLHNANKELFNKLWRVADKEGNYGDLNLRGNGIIGRNIKGFRVISIFVNDFEVTLYVNEEGENND